ncbi:hypothetical protein CPB86DRAFT_786904 [Serendipita vermifera]|nr:hypothetical protein CPB86DRAFT_786904 [Serendipita vermifera]
MPSAPNPKRSQPVPAAPRPGAPTKSHNANKTPKASPGSVTPPSSNGAPYSDTSRSSKKLTKAVRGGGGGNNGKGSTKHKKREIGDGPEASLSEGEDDVDDAGYESPNVRTADEEAGTVDSKRVIEGVIGKSVPKKEIDMGTLLAGAKHRPESQNISRGYEMITSPAARPVIPFDRADRARVARHDSISSSTGFTDDSEWENVYFEMDGVDGFPTTTSVKIIGPKHAYADVVKRPFVGPVA